MKVRTQARRDAIVEAATRLFTEMGYERASMNELAKRLGGSKTTLYGYFPSKEALFVAVIQTVALAHLAEAAVGLTQAPAKKPLEAVLIQFGERMLKQLTDDAHALAVYRMVIAEAGHSEVGQLFYDAGPAAHVRTLAGLLAAAMQRGELRQNDPHISALQLLSLITAETHLRLYQVKPAPLSVSQIGAMVRRAVQAFLLGAARRD